MLIMISINMQLALLQIINCHHILNRAINNCQSTRWINRSKLVMCMVLHPLVLGHHFMVQRGVHITMLEMKLVVQMKII